MTNHLYNEKLEFCIFNLYYKVFIYLIINFFMMKFEVIQKFISLSPKSRGFHIISKEVMNSLKEISFIEAGTLHIFIQHTSASLSINENADPTVREDFESFFNRTVPENTSLYKHTLEGTDDMTSHIKSSLLGASVTIPITNGKLNLGTWQGIYLCEHRNNGGSRNLVCTIMGSSSK